MFEGTPLETGDAEAIDAWLATVLWADPPPDLDTLHALLDDDRHAHHQAVVRALQSRRSPRSVPHLRRALERGFDRFDHAASEPGVIAKWFSHALASIGSPDAIAVLEEYASSADPEVAAEMRYRLGRLGGS